MTAAAMLASERYTPLQSNTTPSASSAQKAIIPSVKRACQSRDNYAATAETV
jgi:hypothetical protein